MLTGWAKPFKVNRLIAREELAAKLPRRRQVQGSPKLGHSVYRFNSTHADFIGRDYRFRGMSGTTLVVLATAAVWGALGFLLVYLFPMHYLSGNITRSQLLIFTTLFSCVAVSWTYLFWRVCFRFEFFAHTHYPIRFNRKTRMVHVFRHPRFGGVLSVPWDDVFWHVGRGYVQKFLCDVRGHVMDGHEVVDTFAVGLCFGDDQLERIQSLWEFIYRYMEEGPEAVADHPMERLIHESPRPTWTNCYSHAFTSMGMTFITLRYFLAPLFYPLVLSLAAMRWLVFKTCKEPVWPPEIVAESHVEPNDPHRWEEPAIIAEFSDRPEFVAYMDEQDRLAEQARGRSSF